MSCSCGGSNENCMHCFGTGGGGESRGKVGGRTKSLSDEEVTKFLREHPLLQPSPLQPPEGSIAKHRPHQPNENRHESRFEELGDRSFVSSSPDNIPSVHLPASKRGLQNVNVGEVAKGASTPRCPRCNLRFSHYIELQAHMQVGCPKPKVVALPRIRYIPPIRVAHSNQNSVWKTPGEMTNCSYCGCPVKATNLQKHFGRCAKNPKGHPNSSARKKSVQHVRINKIRAASLSAQKAHDSAAEPKTVDLCTRYAQVNQRDPMDATKLYAFPCRENGKFGSHPLHDGMDDESGPD
jgi:phage FluMu protein Com